jgi:hypothetical protein
VKAETNLHTFSSEVAQSVNSLQETRDLKGWNLQGLQPRESAQLMPDLWFAFAQQAAVAPE